MHTDPVMIFSLAMYLGVSLSRHLCLLTVAHSNIKSLFHAVPATGQIRRTLFISGEKFATCHQVVG